MNENEIAKQIVDAAVEVHRALGGPGLLERLYEEALTQELTIRGLFVERQRQVPVLYKGKALAADLRIDLLVEKKVIVEVKAATTTNPVFESQLLTYLRVSDLRLGLLINFGEQLVKKGIRRVINGEIPE